MYVHTYIHTYIRTYIRTCTYIHTTYFITDEHTNAVEHCIKFLHFIDSQMSRLTSNKPHPLITRTLDDIITHLTNAITSLESLDDIIGMYNEDHTESVIHLILHLYWTLISVLYRVNIYDNTS